MKGKGCFAMGTMNRVREEKGNGKGREVPAAILARHQELELDGLWGGGVEMIVSSGRGEGREEGP